MQTKLADFTLNTRQGCEAEKILRKCVHCGFCNATCPTYQYLGDELDGPRGRIYLIKGMLEGNSVSKNTRIHLDRCLTCRACETTCPSGVRYGRLLDIGRTIIEEKVPRNPGERILRVLLRFFLPYPKRLRPLFRIAQYFRRLLPTKFKRNIPDVYYSGDWPDSKHSRTMLALNACVQSVTSPHIDAQAARVLNRVGIRLSRVSGSGCCGALSQHLASPNEAREFMRRNIDAWWPYIEAGAEAIVMTASGCGLMVKEYGEMLQDDPQYAQKAATVSSMTRDIAEVLAAEELSAFISSEPTRIAFHAPCTMQHGQQVDGVVESVLRRLGFILCKVSDRHLCCGSAGSYSILQRSIASALLKNKLIALESDDPEIIATANIGCLLHLQSAASRPVKHWLELLVSNS